MDADGQCFRELFHNLYMAELDFGKEKMDAYRRSADRVGEAAPSFELSPGTVEPPRHVAVLLSELRTGTESPGASMMRGESFAHYRITGKRGARGVGPRRGLSERQPDPIPCTLLE